MYNLSCLYNFSRIKKQVHQSHFYAWSSARMEAVMIRRCKSAIKKVIVKGRLCGRQLQVHRSIKAGQGQGVPILAPFAAIPPPFFRLTRWKSGRCL